MVTPKTQYNLKNAREYFKEHLAHGDYYSEKNQVTGEWIGAGAEKLGLKGEVGQAAFLAMCEGKNPVDGTRLTARMNTTRNVGGVQQANRRVFFDFVFRPPKSVSLVALCQDARVIGLHSAAVKSALAELEKFAATRVRSKGQQSNRTTGNIVAALFCHDASRALDPLLHTHAVVFNATHDGVENRWKALQNEDMLRAQKLVSSVYDAELTAGLVKLGYGIRREKESYEIASVQRATIEKFSKRRQEIEKLAAAEQAKQGGEGNIFTLRDQVAHDHRARKIKDANAESLRELWLGAMSVDEKAALRPSGARLPENKAEALTVAVDTADRVLFERKSVVSRMELEAQILRESMGTGASLGEVRNVVQGDRFVSDSERNEFASPTGLENEMAIITAAKQGRERYLPLSTRTESATRELDGEALAAVNQILGSRDFVTVFRGGAGTGKSYTLKRVATGINAAGSPLIVAAPQTAQVRDLVKDGLPAVTLAHLLNLKNLPQGSVVVLDEAGQVGARNMRALFALATASNSRIILSGDTRQHGAVEASDALIAIERFAGLVPAELKEIRRQDPKRAATAAEARRIEVYKEAVFAASEGNVEKSLAKLKKIGAISKVSETGRVAAVADSLVSELRDGVSALAVTQTRVEAAAVNEAVTAACIKSGLVRDAREVETFVPRDVANAEKGLARSYEPGMEIQFISKYGSNEAAEVRKVVHVTDDALLLEPRQHESKAAKLSLRYSEKWQIIDRRNVTLGVGSRVQVKMNGTTEDGKKMVNGELCTVRRILKDGRLSVEDPNGEIKTLATNQKVLLPGYCVTSYSAQGKTVETVILSDSGSRMAANQREWYVSISRARRRIKIFTQDVKDLHSRIARPGDDKLAVEIKRENKPRVEMPAQQQGGRRLRIMRSLGARLGQKMKQILNKPKV